MAPQPPSSPSSYSDQTHLSLNLIGKAHSDTHTHHSQPIIPLPDTFTAAPPPRNALIQPIHTIVSLDTPPLTMDSPSSSSFMDTLAHIIQPIWSLNWARYTSWLTSSLTLPLRMLWIPLSYALSFGQAVLAPAGYVLSYLAGWISAIASFLISLEFSVAAFIGVLAGIIMAIASAIVITYFNMHDDEDHSRLAYHRDRSREEQFLKEQYLKEQYLTPGKQPRGLEPDWHWADPSSTAASSSSSPKSARFRRISNLQAQTIHEEEDDSEE
ncbi:hypothetical protein QQS21_004516 [Conoideocrella luteorostrata]|uniref:Uncharacterized protein n=1 Tax=Conoideocrella luteorostrata TaxID=1105319 RepID=A0AAJ0CTN4_9HYPO|nr:hypothetical protein QQS21_004516 [Conoideocrella luteorostrata]